MTPTTQNPYAQFGPAGYGGDPLEPLNRRTSVLAILSLIAGLICFLPGAGVLALILGGAAVLVISQSRGRLGGLGLAITGVVFGLLFSIIQIMLLVGIVSGGQFVQQRFLAPVETIITGLETSDRPKARSLFTQDADKAITDAQLDDFARRIHDEWGPMRGAPTSLYSLIKSYIAVGQRMQAIHGNPDLVPAPIRFEKGTTAVLLYLDQIAMRSGPRSGPNSEFSVVNIGVIARDGTIMWLIPREDGFKLKRTGEPRSGADTPGSGGTTPDEDGMSPPDEPEPPEPATPQPQSQPRPQPQPRP